VSFGSTRSGASLHMGAL